MIDVFYFSIAGHKTNPRINELILEFLSSEYLPKADKVILRNVQKVAENGNYPSEEYFKSFYNKSEIAYNSIAEIKTYCKNALDFYKKEELQKRIIKAINDSNTTSDLLSNINSITNDIKGDVEDISGSLSPVLYSNQPKFESKGITLGVSDIDEVTNGLQQGTVASICAFTGHGKSTFVNSIIFKAALEGKKCCLVSLELAPDIVWPQFEARFLFQEKNIQVTAQDLQFRRVPKDVATQIEKSEPEFLEKVANNIKVIDESYISKNIMLDYKLFSNLMSTIDGMLGGLDLIVFDHVGQFELIFPDCGNKIIKSIQSFTKTYQDSKGNRPVSILAVQANRQGEMRARRRQGIYDLQAISDLNEVERTSSYIIFMYTSDDMKIMQETKLTLAKHRLGAVVTEPVVTAFNPSVITVGAVVDKAELSEDEFNSLDLDLGAGFDDF